jgi:DNA-binding transcriptional LysR family regulator
MSKLENLATFVEVARAGSFSAAARQLQLPRSTISFRIASLERALNLRLLKRSTRSVSLTQEGHELYQSSASLLADLNDALDRAGHPENLLRGSICIAVPSDLPQGPLVDAITSFRAAHREVSFEIRFTNDVLDLVKENIDIAVRLGVEDRADVVRRKVLDIPCGFFAHRRWIERKRDAVRPQPGTRPHLPRQARLAPFEGVA